MGKLIENRIELYGMGWDGMGWDRIGQDKIGYDRERQAMGEGRIRQDRYTDRWMDGQMENFIYLWLFYQITVTNSNSNLLYLKAVQLSNLKLQLIANNLHTVTYH